MFADKVQRDFGLIFIARKEPSADHTYHKIHLVIYKCSLGARDCFQKWIWLSIAHEKSTPSMILNESATYVYGSSLMTISIKTQKI